MLALSLHGEAHMTVLKSLLIAALAFLPFAAQAASKRPGGSSCGGTRPGDKPAFRAYIPSNIVR